MPEFPAHPRRLPQIPLWGLSDSWQGYRARGGVWDQTGRWLSYRLLHYRGRYWDPSEPRLVVGHEIFLRNPSDGWTKLDEAAMQAVTTFVSDNHPPGLDDDGLRRWRRSRLTEDSRLDWGWQRHMLRLDGAPVEGLAKSVDNGFCLVADVGEVALSISGRGFDPDLELFRQRDVTTRYRLS